MRTEAKNARRNALTFGFQCSLQRVPFGAHIGYLTCLLREHVFLLFDRRPELAYFCFGPVSKMSHDSNRYGESPVQPYTQA
jgi:hypothetical protein